MIKAFSALLLSLIFSNVNSQSVGIGTVLVDSTSILQIESNSKGLLIPRLTYNQRNSIISPANSLTVYQIDSVAGFYFFNGQHWTKLISKIDKILSSGVGRMTFTLTKQP